VVGLVAENGYEETTIEDLIKRAGVSRTTFYEQFESKESCLLAAYEEIIDDLLERVSKAFDNGEKSWPDRVRRGLEVLLAQFASAPEVARVAAVEVPVAGPAAQQQYQRAVQRFLPFLAQGRQHSPAADDLPRDIELMAVGGAEAIIFDEIVAGRTGGLRSMLPEILFAVLVPYLGPEAAREEMQRATA
jgi:AcrR family transcriptional regulator